MGPVTIICCLIGAVVFLVACFMKYDARQYRKRLEADGLSEGGEVIHLPGRGIKLTVGGE